MIGCYGGTGYGMEALSAIYRIQQTCPILAHIRDLIAVPRPLRYGIRHTASRIVGRLYRHQIWRNTHGNDCYTTVHGIV